MQITNKLGISVLRMCRSSGWEKNIFGHYLTQKLRRCKVKVWYFTSLPFDLVTSIGQLGPIKAILSPLSKIVDLYDSFHNSPLFSSYIKPNIGNWMVASIVCNTLILRYIYYFSPFSPWNHISYIKKESKYKLLKPFIILAL